MPAVKPRARVMVLTSGSGTNMEAVVKFSLEPDAPYEVVKVLSDRPCAALEKASRYGIPTAELNRHEPDFHDRLARETAGADVIVLAGYLSILRRDLVRQFEGRLINIHPSLLPKFGGRGMYGIHVHEAVLEAKETESGCTCHLVSEAVDQGPILVQKKVAVLPTDSPKDLQVRILPLEHQCLVEGLLQVVRNLGTSLGDSTEEVNQGIVNQNTEGEK